LDPNYDPFAGNYANVYNEFDNNVPQALRHSLYRDGNVGTPIHVLAHIRQPQAPANDPGLIVVYHRLTRHDARFGQVPTPYDGQGLAFWGDIVAGQVPATVTVPDTGFNQTAVVQAPTAALIQQGLAADPAATLLGPYAAGTQDVDPVVTRPLMIVPNRYAALFVTQGMTPKEAFLALEGRIRQENQEIACAPLLEWLRVALTQRGTVANVLPPATCLPPFVGPAFLNPNDLQGFMSYRLSILHADFPTLQPGNMHNSAVLIAQGIAAMTQEQRLARQDTIQHRATQDAPKSPSDLLGINLDRLMRYCQVASEIDLPPLFATLANTKKGKIRMTIQGAVEEALRNLNYIEDFPVSASLATKIIELSWASNVKDDFSLGIHIFSLGSLDEHVMAAQRQLNHHHDTITGNSASPSLLDVVTLQDTKQDICLPRTLAQLRYLVERSEALWQVLLGAHHPVTRQHHAYRDALISNEKSLEQVNPRDPSLRMIVPALLARAIQLDVNTWLIGQARSAIPINVAPLSDIFGDIERERPWERTFPLQYITAPPGGTPINLPGRAVVSLSDTVSTAASTLTAPSAASPNSNSTNRPAATGNTAPLPSNAIVRNVAYQHSIFSPFRALGIKSRPFRDKMKEKGIPLPKNSAGETMCLTFHIIGMCNERCKQAADHIPHDAADVEKLQEFCTAHYKLEE